MAIAKSPPVLPTSLPTSPARSGHTEAVAREVREALCRRKIAALDAVKKPKATWLKPIKGLWSRRQGQRFERKSANRPPSYAGSSKRNSYRDVDHLRLWQPTRRPRQALRRRRL